jgi:hypothetical protein
MVAEGGSMSTVRAARYRRLALREPDKENARILQLLAEEAERGTLCTADKLSCSTIVKNSSVPENPEVNSRWYIGS